MSVLREPNDSAARALLADILADKAEIPNHALPLTDVLVVATPEQRNRLEGIFFDTIADYDLWGDALELVEQTQEGGS